MRFLISYLWVRVPQGILYILPYSVNGSTEDFDSSDVGSIPIRAAYKIIFVFLTTQFRAVRYGIVGKRLSPQSAKLLFRGFESHRCLYGELAEMVKATDC